MICVNVRPFLYFFQYFVIVLLSNNQLFASRKITFQVVPVPGLAVEKNPLLTVNTDVLAKGGVSNFVTGLAIVVGDGDDNVSVVASASVLELSSDVMIGCLNTLVFVTSKVVLVISSSFVVAAMSSFDTGLPMFSTGIKINE